MEFISIKQLQSLSKKISKKVKVGDSIYLYGEIGAGKTTFSRFFIQNFQTFLLSIITDNPDNSFKKKLLLRVSSNVDSEQMLLSGLLGYNRNQ